MTPSQDQSVPYGFCHCGCGGKTGIAKQGNTKAGYVNGEPYKYLRGHGKTRPRVDMSDAAPFKIDGVYCNLLPLTRGLYAILDAEDLDRLNKYRWHAHFNPKNGAIYALRTSEWQEGKHYAIPLHREVLGLAREDARQGDHINGLTLDCRRRNLRPASPSDNRKNRRKSSNNTSGVKGVIWHADSQRWVARINVNKKAIRLGSFIWKASAIRAYRKAEREYYGEFARKE